jgi:uncharacterized protein (TIGR00730 family)
MADLRALCVYCGSSTGVSREHVAAAAELGRQAARRGVRIIFGGGRVGLMGVLADAALAAGGRVTGIIPAHLRARELGHGDVREVEIVDSMHSRKMRMFELSDAFCILPGGLGTLDETFEIVTWKQLGLHDKPILLVNLDGYWDPLLRLIDHQVAAGYVRRRHAQLFSVVGRVAEVFEAIARAPQPAIAGTSERL